MYSDIPFWLSLVYMLGGFFLLAWSSDRFIDSAAVVARALGISPFIIGILVIGFGTSAPELFVSAMSGISGHAGISLGNAYGSCVFNIAVILGVAAMIFPLAADPRKTVPAGLLLFAISALSWFLLRDGTCSRADALVLLALFVVIMPLYCWFDRKTKPAFDGGDGGDDGGERRRRRRRRGLAGSVFWLFASLAVLVLSSHLLVHGAVDFARRVGVSDLLIGLTIVAVGTSLPELASAIQSARKGEHEFVLGNIIGSNLFNTLAVVGIATGIAPTSDFSPAIATRDLPLVMALSLSIPVLGLNFAKPSATGAYTRGKALFWILAYAAYAVVMAMGELSR
ncbi:MAG: calcium/sodium antiporter [Kiritimatiellae bacterium]|nr:calcium/sodium antiporter [Kiritimatiellia bacterium]